MSVAGITDHTNGAERDWTVLPVRLLLAKGDALRALGMLDDASECLSLPISFADDLGDGADLRLLGAEARRVRGSVLRGLGQVDAAVAHKEAALVTYRALGERAREGICLGEVGAVHQSEGRVERARACHAEAIFGRDGDAADVDVLVRFFDADFCAQGS